MTALDLNQEHAEPEKISFWRRQFADEGTELQAVFDFVFCLIAPLFCFYLDPVVFKGDLMQPPLLQSFQLFAYIVTAVEVSVFVFWILLGSRFAAWSGVIGGTLISGGVFSAVIGFAILPYSLMGLVVIIGVLGFIPFLTALAYLRLGWRALQSRERSPASSPMISLSAGVILSLALPALLSLYVSRVTTNSINVILSGDSQQASSAVNHLSWLPFIPQQNLEPLVNAYMAETDTARKEMLKSCYQKLTGENLERRVAIIND